MIKFQHDITLFARRTGCDHTFAERASVPKVQVGDMNRSLSNPIEQVGADVVRMHVQTSDILNFSLKEENDRDVQFTFLSLIAGKIAIKHNHTLRRQRAALECSRSWTISDLGSPMIPRRRLSDGQHRQILACILRLEPPG